MPSRRLLVHPCGGTVFAYDVASSPALAERSLLPIGQPLALESGYSITRRKVEATRPHHGDTELISPTSSDLRVEALVLGQGAGARAFDLADRPVSIGSAADNAISLPDRAVSRHHCRLEPSRLGLIIRDLASTNGTWIDGARVDRHTLRPGSMLRIGRTELRAVGRRVTSSAGHSLVAVAPRMLAAIAEADRYARLAWPVLVRGETGVGKEHVARALHERGPRNQGPFVPVNAGGLPSQLIESELFGHERGAFTGASRTHRGAFEQAHRGTLFLDEVAELPVDVQTRLLRVLETWKVRRLGGESQREVDVRLVCATHADLWGAVQEGRFRADLFYRIHRLVIEVPPLRSRGEDISALADHFLAAMEPQLGPRELEADALARLRSHPWPGNVRELRNVLELAAATSERPRLGLIEIERALRRTGQAPQPSLRMLRETLQHYGGNVSAAARAVGMPRSTFRDRLKDCGPAHD